MVLILLYTHWDIHHLGSLFRAIFVCLWKMVPVSVRYLFLSANGWKEQNWWTLRFPAKKNPYMEKPLFDWPILLQYDVKAISRKFFGHEVFPAERSLNQPKTRCVFIPSVNQWNGFISVRLLFLFCSRVFISRSYENRSISNLSKMLTFHATYREMTDKKKHQLISESVC